MEKISKDPGLTLCVLCDLWASVVALSSKFTTETQRTQRWHRVKLICSTRKMFLIRLA